ncbi:MULTISPECIES: ATP-dependent zinc metalloprotease FtsH [unclassified Francisella]|uniref:ATP-dependent zinc metalloprotease FtsH n=1 Tax=unclassified Francisella TaxID=2610885 RepID=UPI002E3295F9|nr:MULTISPECIES: ATP-dependent zinc metalloprotease FtsH [unclassified Francisella]MED7819586.1 ATP-dependent zinc metalloprotease FtsH [Francisella sp. 19S2-4]MED7830396.1 ATP-dependent zinc metalloprotease FtsH [Francisella sp. 19S2-10]
MAQNNGNKNNMIKNIIFWVLIIGGMLLLFNGINDTNSSSNSLDYSTFVSKLKDNQISSVDVDGRTIKGKTTSGESFVTYAPLLDGGLVNKLEDSKATIKAKAPEKPNLFLAFLLNWLPMLLIFGFFIYMMIKAGGGSKGGPFSVGKSKAKLLGEDEIKVTLEDVAGVDEAKQEVAEIVDFLREPKKYEKIGGKIPKGVLMVGPPGTGKTLLARAIAGEAKVPFFSISGSDFVEMFVGVGASRVRDMFDQAKKKAPCLVFIDEIDAVGRHRGSGMGGGNDEREQTLNQMLVEMDGFADNEGVIVIAATNRPDVLDRALLRPGRFDRQVDVGLPTVKGRESILKVHMKKVALGDDVRADWIARGTPGFSGAELANLVNEAALFAARESKNKVTMADFEKAKDKILMGSERRTMAMTEKEKKLTAYHEAGHAIIGRLMPEHDPVYKVSIIPRGRALGVTMYMPKGDTVSQSRLVLHGRLCSIFGGRIAEELIFGYDHVTTGASNDIQVATDIARNYVTRWGLSDSMGTILYDVEDDGPFGGSGGKSVKLSDSTIREVDAEVRKLIEASYTKAKKLLEENIDILHAMADALMKYETIDAMQVDDLMARRDVREPGDYGDSYKPQEEQGKVIAPVADDQSNSNNNSPEESL